MQSNPSMLSLEEDVPLVEARDIERRPLLATALSDAPATGTVRLTDGGVVYIPAATADPRDPLNMRPWQKTTVVIVMCSFSSIGLSLIGGFGGIIAFYIPKYVDDGYAYSTIILLMTLPTLSMGMGHLVCMPLAIAVGRRIVLLLATLVLFAGALLCAVSTTLPVHLMARMLLGFAAGQSESMVPLIVQEIHFLHERTRALMVQQTVQVIASAVWVLFASPIANSISPSWWYGLGAILAGIQFLLSVFLLPETKYNRHPNPTEGRDRPSQISRMQKPPLDLVTYQPRTWASDMRLWIGPPEWHRASEVLKEAFKLLSYPTVMWAACLGGLTLGINISMATTYAGILTKDPYDWPDSMVSYINFFQVPIALTLFPLLGRGSDEFVQWRARRNDGMYEPEGRLIVLVVPLTVGIICSILYGQGAAHPQQYNWTLYATTMNGYFFAFVGTSIVSTTWLLDSYPTQAGPLLIIICACRGLISCAVSINLASFIDWLGYDGTFLAFATVTGVLGLLIFPLYVYGKQLRLYTASRATRAKI